MMPSQSVNLRTPARKDASYEAVPASDRRLRAKRYADYPVVGGGVDLRHTEHHRGSRPSIRMTRIRAHIQRR